LERFRRLRRRSIRNSPAPSGGSVDHNHLRGSIPATAFTMSIQFHQHPAAMLSSVDLGGARIRVLAGDACGSIPPSATGSAAAAASPIALGPLEGIEILCHDRRASPERRTDKQANASLLGTTRRAALESSGDVGRRRVKY
jgi:hypothetical protein